MFDMIDQDFIAELDAALSNVGSDICWRKVVGDVELWISPLQLLGQEKVSDVITKTDLGANIVGESKRVTLSHAIVGIGEHDLRQYRGGPAVFPIVGKDGKAAKSTLDRYLYIKLGTWGAQFIDDVFSVYADLMETLQKDNLKNVKFDNAKDPREELAELQARVYEIRHLLNMPTLVEETELNKSNRDDEDESDEDESDEDALFNDARDRDRDQPQTNFDPFTVIPSRPAPKVQPPSNLAVPTNPPVPNGAVAQRVQEAALIEQSYQQPPAPIQTPPEAFQSSSQPQESAPVRDDVVDRPSSREPISPPVIDRMNVSKNPRFQPPSR